MIPSVDEWWPDWQGETAVIVASGPSAKDAPLDLIQGRAKVIAVNDSYRLAPWADILYCCDASWWMSRKPKFDGLKLSQDQQDMGLQLPPDVRTVKSLRGRNEILTATRGRIGWGGNSGFQAINLAVQFGATRIVLVGFDMTLSHGAHWHGAHVGLKNPKADQVRSWCDVLDGSAKRLKELGVEVLNASPISALVNFPKVGLADVFSALSSPVGFCDSVSARNASGVLDTA